MFLAIASICWNLIKLASTSICLIHAWVVIAYTEGYGAIGPQINSQKWIYSVRMAFLEKTKVGGLNSWDQSGSRSRTSIVSRLTFENRQGYPSCQDQLFLSRSRFLKSRFFSWDFDASRFLSRLSRRVEIVKICRDASRHCRDLLRNLDIVEKSRHCWGLLSLKMMKSLNGLRNLDEKIQNPRTSRSRWRQTVEKCQNFQILTKFSISIDIFWSGHWCRDEIEISQSRSRYLDRWDLLFDAVEIFSTFETHSLTMLRLRVSIETTLRQIKTPKVRKNTSQFFLWFIPLYSKVLM